MMTRHTLLVSAAVLALAACSDPAPQAPADHGGMDQHAMDAGDVGAAAPAPLPDDGVTPGIAVSTSWIRPHPQGRDVTAAYFTARLSAGEIDRLVAARIDGADRVELHTHTMNEQGMMQMRQVGPQDLSAGETLDFVPGGLHLMVFGLAPVSEGDTVEGVLVFERAGEIPVRFQARNAAPAGMMEH